MADKTVINYDEIQHIVTKLNTRCEFYAALISKTRTQVQALESEWIGIGADKFFNEFESIICPGMQRFQQALALTSEILLKIMHIYNDAEEETARYFSDTDLERPRPPGSLGSMDFGAGAFDSINPAGIGGAGGGGLADLDFGMDGIDVDTPGVDVGDLDFGMDGVEVGEEMAAVESETIGEEYDTGGMGGGGGGGGGEGQGLQGDLDMGVGSTDGLESGTGLGGDPGVGSGGQMEDHIYEGSEPIGSTTPEGTPPVTPQTPGAEELQTPDTAPQTGGGGQTGDPGLSGAAGAAGIVGGVGAGAAAAKKSINDQEDGE